MTEKIKSAWARVAFGDVVELCRERSNNPAEDGFERYVGLDHLDPGDLTIRRWGSLVDGTTFTSVFHTGQVLFGKRRAYQHKLAIAEFDGVCSGDIYVFKPNNDRLLPELLPFICQTDDFFNHAVGTSDGSLSPRTNWQSLASYEFALPPLEEQRRIVQTLHNGESLSNSLDKLVDCVRLLETATIDKLIANLQNDGKAPIPLMDLCVGKPNYGINAPGAAFSEEMPRFIRITDIDDDGNLITDDPVSVDAHGIDSQYRIRKGDLLFARTGTVGKAYLSDGSEGNCVFAGYLVRFTPNTKLVEPRLLFAYTRSSYFKNWAQKTSHVGVQSNINAQEYGTFPIWLPPRLIDQQAFVQNLITLRAARLQIVNRIRECRIMRKNILNGVVS